MLLRPYALRSVLKRFHVTSILGQNFCDLNMLGSSSAEFVALKLTRATYSAVHVLALRWTDPFPETSSQLNFSGTSQDIY
jgi:hypothetical protein